MTVREIGLVSLLEKQGNILYDHWKQGLTQEESLRIRRAQQSSDVYITSANAITLSGEIVNIDGACNRISAMGFGPKEVIILAGRNKIVQDVSAGIARIKNEAAPLNARRLGLDLPCAKLGRCVECDSPQRICRGTLILERRPLPHKYVSNCSARRFGVLIIEVQVCIEEFGRLSFRFRV